jgi:hypothetical protein
MDSLAGGFEGRAHDGENIGRFWAMSLAGYFSPDSGLVYDSGTQAQNGPIPDSDSHRRVNCRRPAGLKPYPIPRVRPI